MPFRPPCGCHLIGANHCHFIGEYLKYSYLKYMCTHYGLDKSRRHGAMGASSWRQLKRRSWRRLMATPHGDRIMATPCGRHLAAMWRSCADRTNLKKLLKIIFNYIKKFSFNIKKSPWFKPELQVEPSRLESSSFFWVYFKKRSRLEDDSKKRIRHESPRLDFVLWFKLSRF